MKKIPFKDQHFNGKENGKFLFCVGVPQSFSILKNVVLENVRTAESMMIAYESYQRKITDKVELIAYSHGEEGKMSTTKAQDDIELYNKLLSHFENQFERTNYWLSFAEAKNGAIIAINVALIAVLITIFDKAPIFCIVAVIFFLISCSISLISFYSKYKR